MKRRRWSVTKRDARMDQEVIAWTDAQLHAPRGVPIVPVVIPKRPSRPRHVRPVAKLRRLATSPATATKRHGENTDWVVDAFMSTRMRITVESTATQDAMTPPDATPIHDVEAVPVVDDASDCTMEEDACAPCIRRAPDDVSMIIHIGTMHVDARTSAWFDVPARVEPVHRRAWTEIYKPHGLSDVIGNASAKSALVEWVRQRDKPVLLAGPVGIGKTAAAHALLESAGYGVVDSNDPAIVEHTLMRKLVPNELPIGLIIDEIDTTEGHARALLIKLVKAKMAQAAKTKSTVLPIVFICENVSDKSLVSLRPVCKVVRMYRDATSVKTLLDKLARAERVPRVSFAAIDHVCNGDMRRATLLFELTSKGILKDSSMFSNDLFFSTPFDAASTLLSGKQQDVLEHLVDAVRSEGDVVPLLVHENYIQCEKSSSIQDVAKLADLLADCDLMDNHPSYQLGPLSSTIFVASARHYTSSSTVVPCKSVAFTSYFPHLSSRRATQDALQSLNQCSKLGNLSATDWLMLSQVAHDKDGAKWILESIPETCHAEFKDFVRKHKD